MYVYAIKPVGKKNKTAKIGKASNVEARMAQLQTGYPDTLEIIECIPCKSDMHAFHIEHTIHAEFKELQVRGEWYKLSGNLIRYMAGIKNGDIQMQQRALEKHKAQVAKGHFDWKQKGRNR